MYKLISYFTAAVTALNIGLLSMGAQAQPIAAGHVAVLQDMTMAKQGLSHTIQYYPERRDYRDRPSRYQQPRYDPRPDPRYAPHMRPQHWNGPRSGPHPGWNQNRPHYRPQYRPAPPRYAPQRSYRSGGNAHINWCYNRYRSYRASDNTFLPNYGPRRLCYSPFI